MDTSSSPAPVTPDSAAPPAPAPAPRSRYAMGSGSNMMRSLLVVLALVAGLVALVPRVTEVRQPPVDAARAVAYAVKETRLPLLHPTAVPDGWGATHARYGAFADGRLTWQVGWTTADGGFVGLKQAVGVTPGWISAATVKGRVTGTESIGGRTWEVRVDERSQTHLVSSAPVQTGTGGETLTVVVSGTVPLETLRGFVASLAPAAAAS